MDEPPIEGACGVCGVQMGGRCPQCSSPVCTTHVFSPENHCERCATSLFLAVGRAGKQHVTIGVAAIGLAAISLLKVGWINGGAPTRYRDAAPLAERIPEMAALWLLAAIVAVGVALIGWGALIAPRRARRDASRRLPTA